MTATTVRANVVLLSKDDDWESTRDVDAFEIHDGQYGLGVLAGADLRDSCVVGQLRVTVDVDLEVEPDETTRDAAVRRFGDCWQVDWVAENGSTSASFVSLAVVLSFLLPLGAFLLRSAYGLAGVL